MRYLLDTCTASDFVKGEPTVLARVKATAPTLIAVSTLTRMEVAFRLSFNRAPDTGASCVAATGTAAASRATVG